MTNPEELAQKYGTKKPSGWKIMISTAGALFAVSHLGLLGYLIDRKAEPPSVPAINIPRGPYSSYKIKAGKDGYEIEYRANDPKVLESTKTLDLDREKKGFFGGGSEQRTEYRHDQYTMEGVRNMGGATTLGEGKSAKAPSVSWRTLEHGHKVRWQELVLLLVWSLLLLLVFLTLDG